MKILHIIHALNEGGAQILVKNYSLRMSKNNDFILLCFRHYKDSSIEKELLSKKINVVFLEDSFNKKINRIFKPFLYIKELNRQLKILKPDIIHTHLQINYYLLFSKFHKNVKFFQTVHSEPTENWNFKKKDGIIDYLATKILIKRNCMRLIALHDEMREKLNKMFKVNNTIVINNGIDISKFKINLSKKEIRKNIEVPENAFVIGHVGRFSEVKNHKFIIEIFERLLKKNNHAFLLLVGNGELREDIIYLSKQKNIEKNIKILSNRDDVPVLMKSMDAFVFPSLFEGVPLTLIEAQMSGLHCVISDRINRYSIISNYVDVLSLEDDINIWVNSLLKTCEEKIVYDNFDAWNIDNSVKKIESLYNE